MTTALLTTPHETETWDVDEGLDHPTTPGSARPSPLERLAADQRDRHLDRSTFDLLADELEEAAKGVSSTRRVMGHPAFSEILALGDDAVPYLLERLQHPGARPLWLRLLGTLTTYEPGAGQRTIPEAAEAWLRWGKRSHHRAA